MLDNERAARQKKISRAIMWIILLVLFVCFIFPFVLVIINVFKTKADICCICIMARKPTIALTISSLTGTAVFPPIPTTGRRAGAGPWIPKLRNTAPSIPAIIESVPWVWKPKPASAEPTCGISGTKY